MSKKTNEKIKKSNFNRAYRTVSFSINRYTNFNMDCPVLYILDFCDSIFRT